MELAQHHGLPTRLLDWTKNPLYAAFFAASGKPPTEESDYLSVYAVDTTSINSTSTDNPVIIKIETTNYNSSYLHAQEGILTLINQSDPFFINNNRWPTFDEVYKINFDENSHKPIKVFKLLETERKELLRLLLKEKVSQAFLMPKLDNAAQSVKTKLTTLI